MATLIPIYSMVISVPVRSISMAIFSNYLHPCKRQHRCQSFENPTVSFAALVKRIHAKWLNFQKKKIYLIRAWSKVSRWMKEFETPKESASKCWKLLEIRIWSYKNCTKSSTSSDGGRHHVSFLISFGKSQSWSFFFNWNVSIESLFELVSWEESIGYRNS